MTQSERSKSKFILLKFIYLKNFNNLHVKHENLTKMKMGFFFHFFFLCISRSCRHDSGKSWLISFMCSTFWKISKKILNNKYMKLNKIHLTVHVTWTTSFMPVHWHCKKELGPLVYSCWRAWLTHLRVTLHVKTEK